MAMESRIYFDQDKFPEAQLVLVSSSASYNTGLFQIRAECVYRGDASNAPGSRSGAKKAVGTSLEDFKIYRGSTVPAHIVTKIKEGNAVFWRDGDEVSNMYVVGEPEVERLATSFAYTEKVKDGENEVDKDYPQQDLFKVSFSAVAAKSFLKQSFTPSFDIGVQSQVVKKSFSDSYNDVFRSETDTGQVSSSITRQIAFDYLAIDYSLTLYIDGMPPYDELIRKLLGNFEPALIVDPITGKEFYNYININNYVLGEVTGPVAEIPPKGPTLLVKESSASSEVMAGPVSKWVVQLSASYQRQGA